MVAVQDREPGLRSNGIGHLFAAAIIGLALAWSLLGPGEARAGWFIDPARFHISAHGQMGCQECHDQVADRERHPEPTNVGLDPNHAFDTDRCAMCHDQTMADLAEGRHGKKSGVSPEVYGNCILCHDPHYLSRRSPDKKVEFKADRPRWEQCGACHEDRDSLPAPAEDDLECLKCHQPGGTKGQASAQDVSFVCKECHFGNRPDPLDRVPLIDPQAYAKTAHAQESCLACHPGAAAYRHDRQKQGDCLACHTRHHEGQAHEAHLTVSCQACHLPETEPVRDFATKRILAGPLEKGPGVVRTHEFVVDDGEETCRRCHTAGNELGAAALVLPAKSIICMPCHAATFSVADTTTIVSLLIFILGLASALGFWFGGSAGRSLRAVFGAVFSARIGVILKALVVDGLLQRRLYRHSPGRWAVHALIFWPFVLRFGWGILALVLTLWAPQSSLGWVLVDKNHPATALLFDLSGLSILIGAGLAMARRFLADSRSGVAGLPGQDRLALALLGGIVVIGFLLEGMRIAMTSAPGGAHYAFIGYALSLFLRGMKGLTEVYGYVWYAHAILTGAFLAYLPFSRMFHILTGPLALALKAASQEDHEPPTPGATGNEE